LALTATVDNSPDQKETPAALVRGVEPPHRQAAGRGSMTKILLGVKGKERGELTRRPDSHPGAASKLGGCNGQFFIACRGCYQRALSKQNGLRWQSAFRSPR